MTTSAELIERVRAAAADSPYAVVERPYGFDLTIDVADAKWLTVMRANGLRRVFTHVVRLKEAQHRFSVTDVENAVRWSGGQGGSGLTLHARASMRRGRIYQYSKQVELGVDADTGKAGKVVDYTFRAGEGRDLVRRVAKEAGWSEQMGAEQRGAIWFAGIIVVAMIIGFGWIGIAALLR